MRSLPESAAVAWLPPDLTGQATAPRPATSPTLRFFELAGASGLPDEVVAPARTAAANAGYVMGWNTGHEAGLARAAADADEVQAHVAAQTARALADLQAAARAVQAAAQSLRDGQATARGEVENQIVNGAFAVAESLVGITLRDDARRGAGVVARALADAPDGAPASVAVAPDDAQIVRELLAGQPGIEVIVDVALLPGDAYARFGASTVNARISAGLDRVRALLEGAES